MNGDGAVRPAAVRARAEVDLAAISANCRRLDATTPEHTALCAVVKAEGYGHGGVSAAKAAIAGGATWLAVATAGEAATMRARFGTVPILTMGALAAGELELALRAGSDVTVWHRDFLAEAIACGRRLGVRPRIHVKHDSGMGRLGNRDAGAVAELVREVAATGDAELAGLWTHFATADEDDDAYLGEQLERFTALAEPLKREHPELIVHAANSAATLREPRAHFDMVRCGIAIYGLDPFGRDPSAQDLTPALSLHSYVADIKAFEPGETAGYGRRWRAEAPARLAVLPIGYGDGVRRALGNRGSVLIRGRRHPIAGTISMDNLTVELAPGSDVEPGDDAVLIGEQGEERILAEEVAALLETINYEVTCGISARVPRFHLRVAP